MKKLQASKTGQDGPEKTEPLRGLSGEMIQLFCRTFDSNGRIARSTSS